METQGPNCYHSKFPAFPLYSAAPATLLSVASFDTQFSHFLSLSLFLEGQIDSSPCRRLGLKCSLCDVICFAPSVAHLSI